MEEMGDAQRRDLILGGVFLGVGALVAFIAAGLLDLQIPDLKTAKSLAAAIVGGIFGLVIVAAGVFLIFLGARSFSFFQTLIGVVVLLFGLPLLGIIVGIPEELQLFYNIAQALVDALNVLLRLIGKLT